MSKINRVKKSDFSEDGRLITFIGGDGGRVSIPSEAMPQLWQMARRAMAAAGIQHKDGWTGLPIQEVNQITSGTTIDEKVALRLDPGTDQEICISLSPSLALQLSDLLREQARKTGPEPTKIN